MTPQEFAPPSSLSSAELQRELERLFGEVEQLLSYTLPTEQQVVFTSTRWAYMPSDADEEQAFVLN